MHKIHRLALPLMFLSLSAAANPQPPESQSQILATVGDQTVTAHDLESAINSSPVSTQFNTLGVDQQAALRGDMLKRLVASRLLLLEAERLGLDRQPELRRQMDDYRLGQLYRAYMDRLRAELKVPDEELAEMKQQFGDDHDALVAAKSAALVGIYRKRQAELIAELKTRYAVQLHPERIVPGVAPDTLLMESAAGLQIRATDLHRTTDQGEPSPREMRNRLTERVELLLVAKAAEDDHVDISQALATYRAESLPAMLLAQKAREWVPNEAAMRAYFKTHPTLGQIAERRHIGQIVVATPEAAEALRKRVLAGESLFKLAGQFSIDPNGRAKDGDMGWVRAGSGMPEIEAALAHLPDGQVSPVVHTTKGYHLVMILERKPGKQLGFESIEDRVRQQMISEHLPAYLEELRKRYQVAWLLPAHSSGAAK